MGSPAAALRVLIGWVLVIGGAGYAIRKPEQCMQAVAALIEGVASWIAEQVRE